MPRGKGIAFIVYISTLFKLLVLKRFLFLHTILLNKNNFQIDLLDVIRTGTTALVHWRPGNNGYSTLFKPPERDFPSDPV